MDKEQLIRLLSSLDDDDTDNGQVLRGIISQISRDLRNKQIIDIEKYISNLKDLVANYNLQQPFSVGDIVQWKEGLKNKIRPQYGEPCIVIEILNTPIFDNDAPIASPYFSERLDIKLGILGENAEFFTFHYDKNRFELRK